MPTVYSTAILNSSDNLYYRVKATYTVTKTKTQVIIDASLQLQAKGTYKLGSSGNGTGAKVTCYYKLSSEPNYTVSTGPYIASQGTYSDWTNRGSAFTKNLTYGKIKTADSISLKFGINPGSSGHLNGGAKEVTVTREALESHKIYLNANGGTCNHDYLVKYYEQTLYLLTTISKTNYVFNNWNTKLDGTGTAYWESYRDNPSTDITLYAIWDPIIYYNANGGSGAPSSQTKTYGTNLTLSSTVPTRSGYVFKGWNTKADGSGTNYSSGGTYSSNATATLYAKWSSLPKKPTISTMTAIRWDETEDAQDDEGTSAKIQAAWSIDLTSDEYGDENTATTTLTVTPQSGSSSGITITGVSGTSGTSGTAVYMVSGLSTDMQYTVTIRVDDEVSYSTKTVILTRAFFIMDFKAGGEAIGIGRAAPDSGLEIGYEATFDDDVAILGALDGTSATFSGDVTDGYNHTISRNNGVPRGTVANNTNLNNVITRGIWWLSGNYTYTNAPTSYGLFEVFTAYNGTPSNDTIVVQRVSTQATSWTRHRNSGTWSLWRPIFRFHDQMSITTHTISLTAAANNYQNTNIDISKSGGWYPVGIVGWYESGTAGTYMTLPSLYLSGREIGSATLKVVTRNLHTSNAQSITFTAQVLWTRAELS